jgi:hypothetical protein
VVANQIYLKEFIMNTIETTHEGLTDKEIRDYLAQELNKCRFGGSEQMLIILEKKHKALLKEIEDCKKSIVLNKLIKSNGWKDHDVSDYVINENINDFCPPFIGTEEEYNEFIKKVGN